MTEVKRPRRPRRPAGSRNHPMPSTILGAIESGASVIEELHGEMEEWASSLESNSMEHLPKYEEVGEARNEAAAPLGVVLRPAGERVFFRDPFPSVPLWGTP